MLTSSLKPKRRAINVVGARINADPRTGGKLKKDVAGYDLKRIESLPNAEVFRRLAARMVAWDDVEGVQVLPNERALMVETHAPDAFYSRLPALSLEHGLAIKSVYSDDDNLEAVFNYLVES